MEALPREILYLICSITDNHIATATIVKSLNKHFYGLVKTPKTYRLIEWFIKNNNPNGVKWYLGLDINQRYRKFLVSSVRRGCHLDLIAHIMMEYCRYYPPSNLAKMDKFIKTIIRYNRIDVLDHMRVKYNITPSTTYLHNCIVNLNYQAAEIIAQGLRPANYYILGVILLRIIRRYTHLSHEEQQALINILRILSNGHFIHHKHIDWFVIKIYDYARSVDLMAALLDSYNGPKIGLPYYMMSNSRKDINIYLFECKYVYLI